jgi:uncharacterized protein YktB (UPF0637 family)
VTTGGDTGLVLVTEQTGVGARCHADRSRPRRVGRPWRASNATPMRRSAQMNKREEYLALMEKQLGEWKEKIEPLLAEAEQWEVRVKRQYEANIEALHAKRKEALQHLSDLRQANDESWAQIKSNTDASWEALKEMTERLRTVKKK